MACGLHRGRRHRRHRASRSSRACCEKTDAALQHWAETSNPFYDGPHANLLSVLPFAVLTVLLLLVGREKLLGGPKRPS